MTKTEKFAHDTQQFAFNLMAADKERFSCTILYVVFNTIKANKGRLTKNLLNLLLCQRLLVNQAAVDGALTTLLMGVDRNVAFLKVWLNKNNPVGETILHVNPDAEKEIKEWLESVEQRFPELKIFNPPIYVNRQNIKMRCLNEIER